MPLVVFVGVVVAVAETCLCRSLPDEVESSTIREIPVPCRASRSSRPRGSYASPRLASTNRTGPDRTGDLMLILSPN
jgi:hypothetical protein